MSAESRVCPGSADFLSIWILREGTSLAEVEAEEEFPLALFWGFVGLKKRGARPGGHGLVAEEFVRHRVEAAFDPGFFGGDEMQDGRVSGGILQFFFYGPLVVEDVADLVEEGALAVPLQREGFPVIPQGGVQDVLVVEI